MRAAPIVLLLGLFLLSTNLLSSPPTLTKQMSVQDQTIELIHGSGEVNHAIIWLHGLGATSSDFPPIVPELGLSPDRTIRFIFPQAPSRPITINGGMVMPGWYDIKGAQIEDKQDADGMQQSQAMLEALITQQVSLGVPSQNIIVAGFSQGGAVAYHTFIRTEHTLAGMLNLSTYLPFADNVKVEQSGANKETPIFASHGSFDPMVPVSLGETSKQRLQELGYKIEWKTYPMEHQVMMPQIVDIGRWINSVFEN